MFNKIICKISDIMNMEGYTLEEMAKVLKIKPNSVLKRLEKAGIEPISRAVLYDKSALEAISNVQMGRPRKATEPAKKPKK
jgi:Mn-dependent DtxR family transcriptional regulator